MDTTGDGAKTVTSNSTAVCTVSGLDISYVGVGTCSLTAHVAAGVNYSAADGGAQTFTVASGGGPPPATDGYWTDASDGGIFSFGNAAFFGSMGGSHLNMPMVGMAGDANTGGYWTVASDGGIFSFNAPFQGSMGGSHLNKPMVGMAEDPLTGGYWTVASDGGVFSFHANFHGSMGGSFLNKPMVGMAAS